MKLTLQFWKIRKVQKKMKIICNPNHLDVGYFNVCQNKFPLILLFFCLPSLTFILPDKQKFKIILQTKCHWNFH